MTLLSIISLRLNVMLDWINNRALIDCLSAQSRDVITTDVPLSICNFALAFLFRSPSIKARSGNLHKRMSELLDVIGFSIGETFGPRSVSPRAERFVVVHPRKWVRDNKP